MTMIYNHNNERKNMPEQRITLEQKQILNQLLGAVLALHSFDYTTLTEAKKTVSIGSIKYCFDALSLCRYHSNLRSVYIDEFDRMLSAFYNSHYNREWQKEVKERVTLFHYLTSDCCPYQNYAIKKATRPDFVLENAGTRIGVEVVELTSPHDQVLLAISKDFLDRGYNTSMLEMKAVEKHGEKAHNYEYWDINGKAYILSRLGSTVKQQHFAIQLYEKYRKYISNIPEYDSFLILGDAQRSNSTSINDENDVRNVLEWLDLAPDIGNVSFAILWQKNCGSEIKIAQQNY